MPTPPMQDKDEQRILQLAAEAVEAARQALPPERWADLEEVVRRSALFGRDVSQEFEAYLDSPQWRSLQARARPGELVPGLGAIHTTDGSSVFSVTYNPVKESWTVTRGVGHLGHMGRPPEVDLLSRHKTLEGAMEDLWRRAAPVFESPTP